MSGSSQARRDVIHQFISGVVGSFGRISNGESGQSNQESPADEPDNLESELIESGHSNHENSVVGSENFEGEIVETLGPLGESEGPIEAVYVHPFVFETPDFVPEHSTEEDSDVSDSDDSYRVLNTPNSRKRLTPDRIQRFPTFVADQKSVDDGCVICIDGVEINKPMIRLDCNHFYCSECITKWFEKSRNYPLCKREYEN